MYVPDAFREWGETLYEWNTLCETRAVGGSGSAVHAPEAPMCPPARAADGASAGRWHG